MIKPKKEKPISQKAIEEYKNQAKDKS